MEERLRAAIATSGGNLEWFAWYFDQGLMSWDDARRQLELFARHIIPEFGG